MFGLICTAVAALNFYAALSMLAYSRGDAKFKRHVSVLAYVLIAATVTNIFRYLTQIGAAIPFTYPELFWQSIVCGTIILRTGNVSYLLPWGAGK